ncbi:MAG: hypothetical protein N2Z79_00595, partial [Candidatus Omnitrophica bacterium]|nr:hypothetical protein [Candidatus Omnitrophota bacterium]
MNLKEDTLGITFLISLFIHTAILFYGIDSDIILRNSKKEKDFQITYINYRKDLPSPEPRDSNSLKSFPKELVLKKTNNFNKIEKINSPFKREIIKPHFLQKPTFSKTDIIAVKKRISLPSLSLEKLEKIDNPHYLNYYQIVREKIRRCAYQNYNRTDIGQVYLSFVISSDGYLKEIKLSEEKSTPN